MKNYGDWRDFGAAGYTPGDQAGTYCGPRQGKKARAAFDHNDVVIVTSEWNGRDRGDGFDVEVVTVPETAREATGLPKGCTAIGRASMPAEAWDYYYLSG